MSNLIVENSPLIPANNLIGWTATQTTKTEQGTLLLTHNVHAINLSDNTYVIVSELLAPSLPDGKEVIHRATLEVSSWAQLTSYISDLIPTETEL